MRLRFVPRMRYSSCELRVYPTGGERISDRLERVLKSEGVPAQFCERVGMLRYDVSGLCSLRRALRSRTLEQGMLTVLLSDLRDALAWICTDDHRGFVVLYDDRHVFVAADAHLRLVAIPLADVPMGRRLSPQTLLRALCDAGKACRLAPREAAGMDRLRSYLQGTQGALSLNRLRDVLGEVAGDGHGRWKLRDLATDESYPLMPDIAYLMGRGERCDIALADCAHVSRRHVRVTARDDAVLMTDVGSANGTTVDGRRIGAHEEVSLGPGTRFSLAGRDFVVECGASRS